MLCAVAALAFASCEKPEGPGDDDKNPGNNNPGTEATEGLFVYGGATTSGFDLEAMETFDEIGGLYSWEGYLLGGAPFQFPTQSDSEWPAYMLSEDEEGNIVLVYGESEDDLVVYTVEIDGTYEVIIDMRDANNVIAEIALVAPDLSKMEITEIYILGDATAGGWNLMAMGEFTDNGDGTWTYEGPLKAMVDESTPARFRFPLQQVSNTWWPCLMAGPDGQLLFGNRDADEVNTPVEVDGMYRIVLDLTDKENNNMTYTITLLEEGLPDPEITNLYLLGPAGPAGWDLASAPALENNNGIFTWEGDLKGGQEFRMNAQNGTDMWFPAIVKEIATGKAVYCENWDAAVYEQFKVAENGTYRITVDARDFDNITVEIVLVGAGDFAPKPEVNPDYFVKELYMMGPAFDGGYTIPAAGTAAAFSYNDGIWTWQGELAAGEFRFQTQDVDYVPCLFLGASAGTLVYVDNYADAGVATHLSVAEAGTYKIVVDGRSQDSLTYEITKL